MSHRIRIPQPPIFNFQECLWYLDRGYNDCLYKVEKNSVTRAIRIDDRLFLIRLSEEANDLSVSVLQGDPSGTDRDAISRYVSDWFDLERDIAPFYELLGQSPLLHQFPQLYHGLRLIGIPDLFEALCWCITGQQINLSFAHRLKRRLVEQYGDHIDCQGQKYYCFPSPEVMERIPAQELAAMQFSRQKSEYLRGLSGLFSSGELSKERLLQSGAAEQLHQLMQVKGIGEWTANYVLMKSMKVMHCIPFGDAGLNKALQNLSFCDSKPGKAVVSACFSPFKNWESYLVCYLWRSLC